MYTLIGSAPEKRVPAKRVDDLAALSDQASQTYEKGNCAAAPSRTIGMAFVGLAKFDPMAFAVDSAAVAPPSQTPDGNGSALSSPSIILPGNPRAGPRHDATNKGDLIDG
jgi:hypothetical protein